MLQQDVPLAALFERAWTSYEDADAEQSKVALPLNAWHAGHDSRVLLTEFTVLRAKASLHICICAQDAIRWLQAAVARVSAAGVLSSNEEVDDIPTADLKYLLLPYMQGYLLSDSRERDVHKRLEGMQEASSHLTQ